MAERILLPPACSVAGVRARLEQISRKPNKALGQNFLVDEPALHEMLAAVSVAGRPVIEIGAGLGALTFALLGAGAKALCTIEKDAHMADALQEATASDKRVSVYREDALKSNFADMHAHMGGGELLIAGNLPYYITTPLILHALNCGLAAHLLFMLQQEAADRFFAQPSSKQYGPLTVFARCGYACTRVMELSPSSYFPQPDVHSSVVLLTQTATPPGGFLEFLQSVFAMRRKTLVNNLLTRNFDKPAIYAALEQLNIAQGARAESLPHDRLLALYLALYPAATKVSPSLL